MQSFIDLRFKPENLAQMGLPDIAYPIPAEQFRRAIADGGQLPLAAMLYGLQEQSRQGLSKYQEAAPTIRRLADIAAIKTGNNVVTAQGDDWWLEIGPVDLSQCILTIQRGDELLVAIAPRPDGRLRVSVYNALDAGAIEKLFLLSGPPFQFHGMVERENNWEFARSKTSTIAEAYASLNGQSYLSIWEYGIGIDSEKGIVPTWRRFLDFAPRNPDSVAAELGVFYLMCSETELEAEESTEDADDQKSINQSEHVRMLCWPSKRQQQRTVRARFRGCLLGGAVGDALGAPIEFLSRAEIIQAHGPRGLTSYAPAYGGVGKITDDTQMTLFTAEGLLRGFVRVASKGVVHYPSTTAHAYLRWLRTQGLRSDHGLEFGQNEPGWLFQQKELHSRRAPGHTCLTALREMRELGDPARNDSKGCGGVMRAAPVGLFAWRYHCDPATTAAQAFKLGADIAALTHGHPTGFLAAGFLATLILVLVDAAPLSVALKVAKACLQREPNHEEAFQAIELAERLAKSELSPPEALAKLGAGWVAEEALAISIYCALVGRTFREGVILAINHDGDSDSTGAITGNLLGAMYGERAIPRAWLESLELRGVVNEIADDLYTLKDWRLDHVRESVNIDQAIWNRYPGF